MKKNPQYDLGDTAPNTYGRTDITCPYCGSEEGDSWERRADYGEEVCDNCGEKFKWSREITVEYNSDPA